MPVDAIASSRSIYATTPVGRPFPSEMQQNHATAQAGRIISRSGHY
ncbi:MAG: hypothetical protein VB140_03200 [Burkholderia sp.]